MSKVSLTLKLLILLKNKKRLNSSEIAEDLEISKRHVQTLVEDLDKAGVYLSSFKGRYGGYELVGYDDLLNMSISSKEVESLSLAIKQLKEVNFPYIQALQDLNDKIKISHNRENVNSENNNTYCVKTFGINHDDTHIIKNINVAIMCKNKIIIQYNSLSSSNKSFRVVNPYAIINYKQCNYLIAYCEKRQEIRYFKICRIESVEKLDEKFEKIKKFNLAEYVSESMGIFKDESINLKLKVRYPLAQTIKEKIWTNNQKITEFDGYIIFEATTMGKVEIKAWILSLGSSAEVLSPESLRKEIKDDLTKMIKDYSFK